jgi:hypothetical protein
MLDLVKRWCTESVPWLFRVGQLVHKILKMHIITGKVLKQLPMTLHTSVQTFQKIVATR